MWFEHINGRSDEENEVLMKMRFWNVKVAAGHYGAGTKIQGRKRETLKNSRL